MGADDGHTVVEPQVIDLPALRDAVEPKTADPIDPIEFPKVTSLRLSYRNIAEISNLNNFDSLQTLRLDNNIIDRIDNLDRLPNLTWLDLSFNNIREISGLDGLKKLEDISFYHNQIEEIKGLDSCKNLNVLSLGRNKISDLKQVNYLRKFPNLRCICLEGNKICQSDSYQQHVLAYLVHLTYLDYMLIDRKQVAQIQESYQLDELTELKEQEAEEAAKEKQNQERVVVAEKLRSSFLDTTMNLLEDLFSPTETPEHIQVLNCYTGLKEEYKEKLTELLKTLYVQVQDRNEERLKKMGVFEKQLKETQTQAEADSTERLKSYQSKMKKILQEIKKRAAGTSLSDDHISSLNNLKEESAVVEHDLMDIEVEFLSMIDDHITNFESQMGEIIKIIANAGKEFFQVFEEIENTFKNDLMMGVNTEMEAVQATPDVANPAGGEEARRAKLLSDREGMMQALAAFSDAHVLLIQTKDDQMQAQMQGWITNYFEERRKDLLDRNRARLIEIKDLTENIISEIDGVWNPEHEQAEEEDDA